MTKWSKLSVMGAAAGLGLVASNPAFAAVESETAFVFNSFAFLVSGFLVMWMAAGFAMLEAGLVRTKNVAMQCLKNIGLFAIATLTFWLVGYNGLYGIEEGGYIGTFIPWGVSDLEMAFLTILGDENATEAAVAAAATAAIEENGYATASDWFFQVVFVATAASIVSGTVAERVKLIPFFIFVVVLTAIIYPIYGSWTWGAGWLAAAGFSDFAGSTIVHGVGGWAALAGALVIGARKGKFTDDGKVVPIPGSSMPLATLGTFILWMGWFGFNGGSQLALGSAADAISMSNVYINTNMAAAAGVIVAMIMTRVMYGKIDLTMTLNGALAGLVAITADPLSPGLGMAAFTGAVGSLLAVLTVPVLDKLKIDDVVGAIPVHLVAGIWGTFAVAFHTGDYGAQILGIVAAAAFVFTASLIVWFILKVITGVRMSEEDELAGGDAAECGLEAYPEFGRGSQFV